MLDKIAICAVAAALLGPSAAVAQSSVSSASCTVSAVAGSSSSSNDAFVTLGTTIGKHVCGNDVDIKEKDIISDVAVAYAAAVASASVDCTLSGNAEVEASAVAEASASASAYAEALAAGWAGVESCDGCTAAADVLVSASKEVFVSANAKAEASIKAASTAKDEDKRVKDEEVVIDIEKEVLVAYASVFTRVRAAAADDGSSCGVELDACAAILTDPLKLSEFGCCEVDIGSDGTEFSPSATAEAVAEAGAFALKCEPDATTAMATADLTAVAVAEAFAEAVSKVDAFCQSTQGGSACVWGTTAIQAFAEAHATAVAEAFADADNECGCVISTSTLASAVGSVFVDAMSDITLGQSCTSGAGSISVSAAADAVSSQYIRAIAEAFATATFDGESCGGSVAVNAAAGACVASGHVCGKLLSDDASVEPCCDADHVCVQRRDRAWCKATDDIPTGWQGTIRSSGGPVGDTADPETPPPPPPSMPPPPPPPGCQGSCADNFKSCAKGLDDPGSVQACCSDGYVCTQRTETLATCRRVDERDADGMIAGVYYEGTIRTC